MLNLVNWKVIKTAYTHIMLAVMLLLLHQYGSNIKWRVLDLPNEGYAKSAHSILVHIRLTVENAWGGFFTIPVPSLPLIGHGYS